MRHYTRRIKLLLENGKCTHQNDDKLFRSIFERVLDK